MEEHGHDPKPHEDPWDQFSAEFKSLGNRLQATYREVVDEQGPSEEELREAFSTLARAWGLVAGTVGTAFNDPETRSRLKLAATTFATAVGTTLADLGNELNRPDEEE